MHLNPSGLGCCPFLSGGSVVVDDLLFYVLHIVCGGSVFVFDFLCITLCPYNFSNHLEEEEKAGRFSFIVLQMSCKCSVALPHGAMGWSTVCGCGIT